MAAPWGGGGAGDRFTRARRRYGGAPCRCVEGANRSGRALIRGGRVLNRCGGAMDQYISAMYEYISAMHRFVSALHARFAPKPRESAAVYRGRSGRRPWTAARGHRRPILNHMASIIPRTHAEFLSYLAMQAPVWEERFASIGVSHDEAAAVGSLLSAAEDARFKRAALEAALRAAVEAQDVAFDELRAAAGRLINRVRAFAESQEHPGAVYAAAQIPAPRPHSRRPLPARPTGLRAVLIAETGAIRISWKARQPAGTEGATYAVYRRVMRGVMRGGGGGGGGASASGPLEFLDIARGKQYEDRTLVWPVGSGAARAGGAGVGGGGGGGWGGGMGGVQYAVQSFRSGKAGPMSDILSVQIGASAPAGAAARGPLAGAAGGAGGAGGLGGAGGAGGGSAA